MLVKTLTDALKRQIVTLMEDDAALPAFIGQLKSAVQNGMISLSISILLFLPSSRVRSMLMFSDSH